MKFTQNFTKNKFYYENHNYIFFCARPEFDGHLVDFDEAMKRQRLYKTVEGRAVLREKEGATHHGGCGHCE